MKKEKKKILTAREAGIVREFQKRVRAVFPEAEFVLFGSTVRGERREYSDIDILIILDREVNTKLKEQIYDIGYDLELENDVILGSLIESRAFWESDLAQAMPLKQNVDREGVKI
jgi:predicted nucleotidyltransferase